MSENKQIKNKYSQWVQWKKEKIWCPNQRNKEKMNKC